MKSELKDFEREAYEDYVNALIDAPKDPQKLLNALDKFISGSTQYEFLRMLTIQKLNGCNIPEQDRALFDKILKNQYDRKYSLSGLDLELRVRHLLLKFDSPQLTVNERMNVLQEFISEGLQYGAPHYQKPYSQEHKTEVLAAGGNQEPTKKQATFDYNFDPKHIKE